MSAEIWVWVEHDGTQARKASLEALGKARALGGRAVALVLGAGAGPVVDDVARRADRVLVLEGDPVAHYLAGPFARALGDLAAARRPAAILAGASFAGRELMPRLAARIGAAYLADCTDLEPDGASFSGRRAIHGGKAYAWLRAAAGRTLVATLRPNTCPPAAADLSAELERVAVEGGEPVERVVGLDLAPSVRPELSEAEVVVAGGRGLASPEGFRLVEALADALGGAVGASRAVVDAGWRSHGEQVGKSGKTVSPRLYVALGISGAIHHVMGMDTARFVVAVNSDPAAPIFGAADYGLAADLATVVPLLVERLGAAMGSGS